MSYTEYTFTGQKIFISNIKENVKMRGAAASQPDQSVIIIQHSHVGFDLLLTQY